MTRKEETKQAAKEQFPSEGWETQRVAFVQGARWADKTMLEKLKNFIDHHTDIEDVYEFLKKFNKE